MARRHEFDLWSALPIKEVIESTGIETGARALATRGEPPPDQTTWSLPEIAAKEKIEQRCEARGAKIEDELQAIRDEIAVLPQPDAGAGREDAANGAIAVVMGLLTGAAPVASAAIAAERTARAELNSFRVAEGAGEAAVYPVSRIRHFALIVLVLLMEAAANMFVFAGASANGLVGAFLTALLVAVCNIAVAVFAGLVPARYINRSGWRGAYWAWPLLVVSIAVILAINAFAAHYRELGTLLAARGVSPEEAFQGSGGEWLHYSVLGHMLADPTALSLQSWALLIVGVLLAVVGAVKGYTASDPLPGYEARTRRAIERQQDVDAVMASLGGALDGLKAGELADGRHRADAGRQAAADLLRRQAALDVRNARVARIDSAEQGVAERAIERFRDVNRQVRADGKRPAYFDQPIDWSRQHEAAAARAEAIARLGQELEGLLLSQHDLVIEAREQESRAAQVVANAKINLESIMRAIERGGHSAGDGLGLEQHQARLRASAQTPAGSSPALPQDDRAGATRVIAENEGSADHASP